eukprot:TRINITY_DN8176_c0_g1_i1.p1 TRINITY_DN8176_c0_g1~~TRINITY_DN8176_c0_g1_i1.p1  ORF type:complete len:119 (-),score=23.63 TRINITY_DN8176_c0_g1_i1:85-441(-)
MCEEWGGSVRAYKRFGMEQLRLPVLDYTAPDLIQIERALDFISKYEQRGERVYVHCKAGRGRSAAVVAAWIMVKQNVSQSEAQKTLSRIRPAVSKHLHKLQVLTQVSKTNAALFYGRK